jgi:Bifunctional DNA primase/polymerase, N-terminal/Primase C terminal 1 (PriCT-1)
MSGIFRKWQPRYAERGIPTFPLDGESKKPRVTNFSKMGLPTSRRIAEKPNLAAANGIGFMAGPRNKITVLDIDVPDERVAAAAFARHGEPAIIVRTPSRKFHGWYRHNGERRTIDAWKNEYPKHDVLGAGIVVAPPTRRGDSGYEFVKGSLEDLDRLQPMEGVAASLRGNKPAAVLQIGRAPPAGTGARNNSLYRTCMRQAHGCTTFDDLLAFAREANAIYSPPLEETEVMDVAKSAWDYTERGQNRFGQHGAWFPVDEVAAMLQYQDAFVLLAFLRAHEGPQATFMIANGLAEKFGWPRQRLAAARRCLIELGYVEQIRRATTGLAALFRWS